MSLRVMRCAFHHPLLPNCFRFKNGPHPFFPFEIWQKNVRSLHTTPSLRQKEKRCVVLQRPLLLHSVAQNAAVSPLRLVQKMQQIGCTLPPHASVSIADDDALLTLAEFGIEARIDEAQRKRLLPRHFSPGEWKQLPRRPLIVAVMGHVDHGKTTLIDCLRGSNLAASEAGGITQRLGVHRVNLAAAAAAETVVTFIDTPGHEAFEAARRSGIAATDFVLLVVAADDGVMPQTREAIAVAHAAVPLPFSLLVAVTKCDAPGADFGAVLRDLQRCGVDVAASNGGEDVGSGSSSKSAPAVAVSTRSPHGTLKALVSALRGQTAACDVRGAVHGPCDGAIVECSRRANSDVVATIVVRNGTLRLGVCLVTASGAVCRVRTCSDAANQRLDRVTPGATAEVRGWGFGGGSSEALRAGDWFVEVADVSAVRRELRSGRLAIGSDSEGNNLKATNSEGINLKATNSESSNSKKTNSEGNNSNNANSEGIALKKTALVQKPNEICVPVKRLPVMLFADAQAAADAICKALLALPASKAAVEVLRCAVGVPLPADVDACRLFGARIFCFGAASSLGKLQRYAASRGVSVSHFDVIYALIAAVRDALCSLLPPAFDECIVAKARVVQTFSVGVRGRRQAVAAGCVVVNGPFVRVTAGDGLRRTVRVLRDTRVVHAGDFVASLRRFKEEVGEVAAGGECGVRLEAFDAFAPGDTIEIVQRVERSATL